MNEAKFKLIIDRYADHKKEYDVTFTPRDTVEEAFKNYDLETDDPCFGCSNHPSNGGSGVCHCTLPYLNKRCKDCYVDGSPSYNQWELKR